MSLVRPTHHRHLRPRRPFELVRPLIDTLARALEPEGHGRDVASFTEIRINDGTVILRDDATRHHRDARRTSSWRWPGRRSRKSFAATGRFVWHDEPIDATITLTDFVAALAGDRSGLKVRLTGAPLKFAFDGTGARGRRSRSKARSPPTPPRCATRCAGPASSRSPAAASAASRSRPRPTCRAAPSRSPTVNVELDGNVAEGVLTFATDGRQTLQGTLAADELDLTPYVSTVRLLTSNERDWNRVPLALDGLTASISTCGCRRRASTIARAKLGRTAVAANLRGGKLTVTIGESQAFGGVLKGSMALATSDAGAEFKSQLQFADVDLEQCLGEMFGIPPARGPRQHRAGDRATGNSVCA